jgi:hypothetical protein
MAKADSPKEGQRGDSDVSAIREVYENCKSAEQHNRQTALEDIEFARRGEQWPETVRAQRIREGRPCLTINKLPTFIRQVVNDSRQNKPSIKVRPADSKADPETADVLSGLIRNIEYVSNADVAYDTGIESAVAGGFGYWRVVIDFAHDDAFDLDLLIKRVSNPFSVYGDPNSAAADSSDWDTAFVVDRLSRKQFETRYKGKAKVSWDDDAWTGLVGTDWRSDDKVLIAEYWEREEVDRAIVMLQDGTVLDKEALETDEDLQTLLQAGVMQVHGERVTKTHKVTQRIMSGLEVLEENDWPGRFIPIIPVYGDEFDIEGKRFFRSLIHPAIDAQRMFNYWRTASTELVALAPKVPFIGKKGTFDSDQDRWQTANTRSHAYLEYDSEPPARQPLDGGTAAGAMQEALNASDDMKSVMGLYDASLGARSNETSGRAILARQREGDISTFHFIDNLSRAIRHTGRILIDLIPHVYSAQRIIRVLGEDGKEENVPVNQEAPAVDPETGQPMQQQAVGPDGQPMVDPLTGNPIMEPVMRMHDLSAGKYDLTVESGPSYTTRREEAAAVMTELIQAYPASAPIVAPELFKNFDFPNADKIAEKMEAQASGAVPPEVQKQMQEGQQQIAQLTEENQTLKMDQQGEMAKLQVQQQGKMQELEQKKELAMIEIQVNEQIEREKIASQERIANYKNQLNAQAQAMRPVAGPNGVTQ